MSDLELKYFILKPRSKFSGDPYAMASRAAMYAYAKAIESEDKNLAKDLFEWANREARFNRLLPEEKK